MPEISIDKIKEMLMAAIDEGYESELTINFTHKSAEYMIIIYSDHCSFQRCGYRDGSGEIDFDDLDTLFEAELIDGIVLSRDWDKVDYMECVDFDYLELW